MNNKFLFTLLFTVFMVHAGFSQSPSQHALREAKNIKAYFTLSSQQKDSLATALSAYYTSKINFQQRSDRTSADTRNLQKLHDDILKGILTVGQYQLYEAVKQQQIQFMQQRIDSLSNQ
jgi:hypothetical protein